MTVLLGRGVLVGLVLLALQVAFGEKLLTPLLPAMQQVFEHLVPEFDLVFFGFDDKGADRVIGAAATLGHYVVVGHRLVSPGPTWSGAVTLVAMQALHGASVALWIALVWPARNAVGARLLRLALLLVPVGALLLADTPVVLAGGLWRSVVQRVAPDSVSPLILARDAFEGGGRLALGAMLGAFSVLAASRLVSTSAVRPG